MSDTQNEHNWKLHEASEKRISMLNHRQGEESDKQDKWLMTLAAGSFGLSFALIDQVVPLGNAHNFEFLLTAWACFIAVLVIGLISFAVSALTHKILAEEESRNLTFKYEGKNPEYKKRSIFFEPNMVLTYVSILLFIGGATWLMVFIAKNLL